MEGNFKMKLDSQQIEIIGRHILIANLLAAGLEVALPIRDRGIDLLAFRDGLSGGDFVACPIQLKTSTDESFSLDKKYKQFPGLRIVYVWLPELIIPAEAILYSLTYAEAEGVLNRRGFDQSLSWNDPNKPGEGRYRARGSKVLKESLEEFQVKKPEEWMKKLGFTLS